MAQALRVAEEIAEPMGLRIGGVVGLASYENFLMEAFQTQTVYPQGGSVTTNAAIKVTSGSIGKPGQT